MSSIDNLFEEKNSNKTKEGLPKLTQKTLEEFNEEIRKRKNSGESLRPLLEKWFKELESENPVLLCHIQHVVNYYEPDSQWNTLFRFMVLYELLKMQTIKDNLSYSQRIFEFYGGASENNPAT